MVPVSGARCLASKAAAPLRQCINDGSKQAAPEGRCQAAKDVQSRHGSAVNRPAGSLTCVREADSIRLFGQFSTSEGIPVRYSRHDLKQDKFAETAAEAVQEVVEHRSGIVKIVATVVVLALLGGGGFWYMSSTEEQATNALGQALVTYNAPVVPPGTPKEGAMTLFNSDQERLIASKNAFYAISDKYGWTHSGQYARYLAGVTEKDLGNYKVAEDQLRALSNTRRRELASLAKYALASVYRDEKRDQDAINLLQALIDKPSNTVPKANAQLALADLYSAAHQPDKAKVIYDQITKENPKNEIGEIAKAHQEEAK
jgi:tetratricopeptide (TPR) repeat protein